MRCGRYQAFIGLVFLSAPPKHSIVIICSAQPFNFYDVKLMADSVVSEDPVLCINQMESGEDLDFSPVTKSLALEEKNKFLQEDIVQYLKCTTSRKQFYSNVLRSGSGGKMKNWNLVKQRFHEKDVFFSKEPKVDNKECFVLENNVITTHLGKGREFISIL